MARSSGFNPTNLASHQKHRLVQLVVGVVASLALLVGGYAAPAAHAAQVPRVTPLEFTIISASDGGFKGHSFIMLKNISKDPIKILGFNLKAGKIMTIGTFGNKSDGKGVYLNLEAYKNHKTDRSLMMKITKRELNTLVKFIKEHNYWSCPTNCSSFASGAWNLIAPKKKDVDAGWPINTPYNLEVSIKSKAGNKANINIPDRAKENVRRLLPDGTLKKASTKTLNAGSSGYISYCFS